MAQIFSTAVFPTAAMLLAAAIMVAALAPQAAHAQNMITNGLWSNAANWVGGLPDPLHNVEQDVVLNNSSSTVDGNYNVNFLSVNTTSGTYSLSGAPDGSLTRVLQVGQGAINVNTSTVLTIDNSLTVRIWAEQLWFAGVSGSRIIHNGLLVGTRQLGLQSFLTNSSIELNNGSSTFFGGFSIASGNVNLSNDFTQAGMRFNYLAGPSSILQGGANADLRLGEISNGGTINSGLLGDRRGIFQQVQVNATSLANINANGLTTRGIATQTYSGNLTGLTGTVTVQGVRLFDSQLQSSGLTIAGSSTTLLNINGLRILGGALTLDNGTNPVRNFIPDALALTMAGGTFRYVASTTGGTEFLGNLNLQAGASHAILNPQSSFGRLAFANLNSSVGSTIEFTVPNPLLQSVGANIARFTFTGGDISNANGVLGVGTAAGDRRAFAIVTDNAGGTNFAFYDSSLGGGPFVGVQRGIRAIAPVLFAGSNDTANYLVNGPETADTTSAAFLVNTLTIRDGGELDISGTNHLRTYGILYTGAGTATITSSGGGEIGSGLNAASQPSGTVRYIFVTNPQGELEISAGLSPAGDNAPITKSGDGFLVLTGTTNQLNFTAPTDIYLAEGVLRGTATNIGGGTSSGGANTTINFRGGVLEIAGGGTLVRALDQVGNASGGAVSFDNGASDRGSGGFSAVGGDLTVTLVTTVGGSTAANLVWNNDAFVADGYALIFGSLSADSATTLTNNIGLDGGSATVYNAREIRVNNNPSSTNDLARLTGVISGSARSDLLKTGTGVLELAGSQPNTFTGGVVVSEGELWIGKNQAIDSAAYVIVGNRGATSSVPTGLVINGNFTVNADVTVIENAGVSVLGGRQNTLATFAGQVELQKGIIPVDPQGFASGLGSVRLTSVGDTYANRTRFTNTIYETPGSVPGGITKVGSGVVELSFTGNNNTLPTGRALPSGGVSAADGLAGNTYTGGTFVAEGTLLVNNFTGSEFDSASKILHGSGTGTGNVTVASGATLGGAGRIGGTYAINYPNAPPGPATSVNTLIRTGGRIAPGFHGTREINNSLPSQSEVGTLTFGSRDSSTGTVVNGATVTLQNQAIWNIDISNATAGSLTDITNTGGSTLTPYNAATPSDPNGQHDYISVFSTQTGALSVTNPIIELTGDATGFDTTKNYSWRVGKVTGGGDAFLAGPLYIPLNGIGELTTSVTFVLGGGFSSVVFPPGAFFNLGIDGDSIFINYNPEPEPATWALLGLGVVLLGYRQMGRRRVTTLAAC